MDSFRSDTLSGLLYVFVNSFNFANDRRPRLRSLSMAPNSSLPSAFSLSRERRKRGIVFVYLGKENEGMTEGGSDQRLLSDCCSSS